MSPKRSEYVTLDGLVRLGSAVMSYVRRKSLTFESWLLPTSYRSTAVPSFSTLAYVGM
ncbi:hypothetical protein [Streptomyces viridochromogenes]|uniref:hypothetical protein n=1 Tax=Streptomyces viridochromogenes TaxID=1938 RepID=UPI00131B5620|nr:hypothetical protein [Streptomyces viridochromogenes]